MKTFDGSHPHSDVPAWAERVPRWQQMDPVGRAIADAWHGWFGNDEARLPTQLIVAIPTASNLADADFAASGAFSPQKFVVTLPSVAVTPILQITGKVIPVLCIQDGVDTVATATAEAELLAKHGKIVVGVLSVDEQLLVSYFEVGR